MANLKGKANMKDIILDVVKHTAGLGFIESVKVTGTTQETRFDAMDTDRTVILNATLHNPNPDLIGEFGMGNLSFLNGVSNLSNYKEDGSEVTVNRRERNGEEQPESLLFKDADGNMPIEPVNMAAISDKISPNKLPVTITSNCFGSLTNCIAALSTSI